MPVLKRAIDMRGHERVLDIGRIGIERKTRHRRVINIPEHILHIP